MDTKKSVTVFLLLVNIIHYSHVVNGCSYGCNTHIPRIPKPSPNGGVDGGGGGSGSSKSCPRDALKLGVCANVLNGTIGAIVANPPELPCCSILGGLLDLEVAVCLCTALKANILGININIPIALSLLIDTCGKDLPPGFKCASD